VAKRVENFTEAERDAMKQRARELKSKKVDGETDVQNRIAEMNDSDRAMALKIHELVKTHAPDLKAKTWYGMPAYARKDGKVVIFFQAAGRWESRLATLGFTEHSNLDDGIMWPTSWSLVKIDAAAEKRIIELIQRAVS
jgi:uncharacterized protein YdhG (YjbR/CyaY superfamily)